MSSKKAKTKKETKSKGKAESKPRAETKAKSKPKARRESFLALAGRMLAAKADEKKTLAEFKKAYSDKGITNVEFVQKRAAIYMRLAAK